MDKTTTRTRLFIVAVLMLVQSAASAWAQERSQPLSRNWRRMAAPTASSLFSPHPHAALLMAHFLLSPEGAKKILGDLDYGSPLKPVSYKLWYPEAGMSTTQYDKAMERWDKLLREIGRK